MDRARPARSGDGRPSVPELVLAGRAVLHGRLQPVEIGLGEAGEIVAVGRTVVGGRRRDLGESVIVPSGVDLHVHFRDPGPPGAIESFGSGTLQAVIGGIGAVADMPNTEPPTDSEDRLAEKADRVHGRSACDVVLYATAASPAAVARIARYAGALKLFGSPTTGIDASVGPSEWEGLFTAARTHDLAVTVHAEAPHRFEGTAEGPTDLVGWDSHRPIRAERQSVEELLRTAGPARLHIAHVTSAGIGEAVTAAGFDWEATPHHLLLSASDPDLGALGKVNPPLRPEPERHRLYAAFVAGRVPVLASDHAPHPRERKSLPFGQALAGVPGVETMLPLFLARVAHGELGLPVLQSASSDRPARWLGLPQGRLALGHRGHLYTVDFRRRTRIRARDLRSPAGWSPFEGWEAVYPRDHYLDGRLVVQDGEYVGTPMGRVLRPEYARS